MTERPVTVEAVGEIIELDDSLTLVPFIRMAHLIVEENLYPLGLLSAARLYEIELLLSAHFYTIRDARVTSESAGVSASYLIQGGQGFRGSPHGQNAISLDDTGTLARMDEAGPKVLVSFKAVPTTDALWGRE